MSNSVKQEEINDAIYELAETIETEDGGEYLAISVEDAQRLINQQVVQALESLRIVKQGKTYSDATDWKHEVELQEEELSRLIKEYKGDKG